MPGQARTAAERGRLVKLARTGSDDLRKGVDGLAVRVHHALRRDAGAGPVLLFRSRRGDRLNRRDWMAADCAGLPSGWNAVASSGLG